MDVMEQVWDLNTGLCIDTLQGHTNVVMGLLCWNQFLISGSLDGTVKVRCCLLSPS
jgi:F-box/WD-40 domain protein 7